MKHLLDYINQPNDAESNFQLGLEYEQMDQTGAAISFYLRTAERAQDQLLQYEALLRMALCFGRQRTRDDTQKVLLQKAMTLCMDRPEAYFLLARAHERLEQWHEGWTISSMALKLCRWDCEPLRTNVEYPGQWGVLFEQAVCAWWVGECEHSRRQMFELRYSWPLDQIHRDACDRNLQVCGWPRMTLPYDPAQCGQIRAPFPGLDRVQKNHSQSLQDMFVLAATQDREDLRWYLEIGSAEPFYHNNTALLETQFGWRGVSLEINGAKAADFAQQRRNPVLCQDAMTLDYEAELIRQGAPKDLGYLQVDCDPPENSFRILTRMPWATRRFAVITFEHDYYADTSVRDRSRAFLRGQGYELIVGDVAFDGKHSYEDWWVHPDLVSRSVRDLLRSSQPGVNPADQYLFPAPATISAPAVITQRTSTNRSPVNAMFNANAQHGVWIVDDFYSDPDWVRNFALQQEYQVNIDGEKGYIGSRTERQFLFDGLKERFEDIIGQPITRWQDHGMNGRFQHARAGEPLVYHCDHQKWAGMIYLTPNAPWDSGTNTYALKNSDIRHISHPDIGRCFKDGSRNFDRYPFDMVDQFGNVYNRLVIFNAGYLHSSGGYFGFTPENSRLWHMFFFD
jgi:hypothetical protein